MHAWGWGCIAFGALLYADALGCARAYGGTWGDVMEFIVATVVVVAGAWLACVPVRHMVGEDAARLPPPPHRAAVTSDGPGRKALPGPSAERAEGTAVRVGTRRDGWAGARPL